MKEGSRGRGKDGPKTRPLSSGRSRVLLLLVSIQKGSYNKGPGAQGPCSRGPGLC